jgi:hypothetical protein
MSRSRVNHHPGGFVYDKEVLIFIDDVERNRLRDRLRRTRGRELDLDSVALEKGLGLRRDSSVMANPALSDQSRDSRPREPERAC